MSMHFIWSKNKGDVLLTCLYVDDLVFTGNNPTMIDAKASMVKEFDMIDNGLMNYIIGIEVKQNANEIFISRKGFIENILQKNQHEKLHTDEYINEIFDIY